MTFQVANNVAQINGAPAKKGAQYGKSAAQNHFGYLNALASPYPLNADTFNPSNPSMAEAGAKMLEQEQFTPVNFLLRYAPKKGFLAKLFTGNLDKQALLGYTAETMEGKKAISVEEFDKQLNASFADTGVKLTAKAFDVNNDGQIDVAEHAVSTVLADILSDEDMQNGTIDGSKIKAKKADGSYTNQGENLMLAFCNEKNTEAASEIIKDIYTDLKLDKAQTKFNKNN